MEQTNPVEINGLLVDEWTILDADPENRLEWDTPNFRDHTFERKTQDGYWRRVTFQPQQLRNGEIVVIETSTTVNVGWSGDIHTRSHLHEYTRRVQGDLIYDPNGWKSHITEKGNWMVSRGDVKTSHRDH